MGSDDEGRRELGTYLQLAQPVLTFGLLIRTLRGLSSSSAPAACAFELFCWVGIAAKPNDDAHNRYCRSNEDANKVVTMRVSANRGYRAG